MTLDKPKGSQPSSRTAEQRLRAQERSRRYYEYKKQGLSAPPMVGLATIGIVAPLAPGATNLSTMMEASCIEVAKRLNETMPLSRHSKEKDILELE